jgi:hypothetical protein
VTGESERFGDKPCGTEAVPTRRRQQPHSSRLFSNWQPPKGDAVSEVARGIEESITKDAIKGLFRTAAKAVSRDEGEEKPEPRRRRSGETDGDFVRLARKLSRRFDARRSFKAHAGITSRYNTIGAEAFAPATGYLFATLDWLNPFHNEADNLADISNSFDNSHTHFPSSDL